MLLGFAFMFIIAFLLINPPTKTLDPKAEAMIVLTWPDGNYDDVDLWLKIPTGEFIGYRSMDRSYAHLERDDLGITNDVAQTPKGKVFNKTNREVIMFRQLVDGRYVVNLHFYREKDGTGFSDAGPETEPAPIPCKVILVQINPVYKELGSFLVILNKENDEETVVQFDIENKEFKNFSQEQYLFVNPTSSGTGARNQGIVRP